MLRLVPQLKEVIDAFEVQEHDEYIDFCTIDQQTHRICVNVRKSVCCQTKSAAVQIFKVSSFYFFLLIIL
jgi:hypothetical protein